MNLKLICTTKLILLLSSTVYADIYVLDRNNEVIFEKEELVNDFLPDKIIGEDNRTKVSSTTADTNRVIGRLNMGCTATIIGSKYLLTAGHCVYADGTWKTNEDLGFTPAKDEKKLPYGSYKMYRAYAPAKWIEDENPDYDLALIVLNEQIGYQLGWMEMKENKDSKASIRVTGYPVDKDGQMWSSSCGLSVSNADRIFYDCDTMPGNSGSPVYLRQKNKDYLIAVHAGAGEKTITLLKLPQKKYNVLKIG